MKKRVFSLLLAFVLIAALLPQPVSAAETTSRAQSASQRASRSGQFGASSWAFTNTGPASSGQKAKSSSE